MIPCSICQRPDLTEIDSALGGGASLRTAASQYGLSKSALGRHRAACLAPKVAAAARVISGTSPGREDTIRARAIASGEIEIGPTDILTLSGLMTRLGRSLERLDVAADEAVSGGALTALAALSAQIHRGIESAARMQGLAKDDGDEHRFSITSNLPASASQTPVRIQPTFTDLESSPDVFSMTYALERPD